MSLSTTILGPRLSFTSGGDQGTLDPSLGACEIKLPLLLAGANALTADPDTTALIDGQFSVTSISVTSAVLAFRSGNTVYTFTNDGTEA